LGATVLRTADLAAAFAAGFFDLACADFAFAVTFLPAVTLLLAGLTDVARFAFGREEPDLATRFAVFADARFAFGRADDRRRPFVRLLLMSGISKRLLTVASSRRMGAA
jgi:hypothetical protein